MFNFTVYLPAAALVFVFALALVAKFQPYKYKRSNIVDVTFLFTTISGFMSSSMYFTGRFMYPKLLRSIVTIPCYLVFLVLASVLPEAIQCCKKRKTFFIKKSEVNEGDRALLNHESTDYISSS